MFFHRTFQEPQHLQPHAKPCPLWVALKRNSACSSKNGLQGCSMKHIIIQRCFSRQSSAWWRYKRISKMEFQKCREGNLFTKIHFEVKPQLGVIDQQRQFFSIFSKQLLEWELFQEWISKTNSKSTLLWNLGYSLMYKRCYYCMTKHIIALETSPAEHQGQRRSDEGKQLHTCRRQEATSVSGDGQGLWGPATVHR